jgi:3'-5' exoribonuclease
LILSFLDDLDAKVTAMQALIKNDTGPDPNWTSFNRLFDRFIYKGGEDAPLKKEKEEKEEEDQNKEPELFRKG